MANTGGTRKQDPLQAFVRRLIPASARRRLRALLERLFEPVIEEHVSRTVSHLDQRLRRIEQQIFSRPYVNPEFIRAQPDPTGDDSFDYCGFQEKFRGPSRMIQDKLRFYLPYFRDRRTIVDIGCGRGEFLEVLRESGLSAVGVEINAGQVAECHRKGLNIVQADLFDYLRALPDQSVDGIFCAQVIEHISSKEVGALFKLSYRKLTPGGVMVAETVNPHCSAAFKFFWLDPTHVAPLYPEVLQFLAESAGFGRADIFYPLAEGDPCHLYHECGEYAIIAEK